MGSVIKLVGRRRAPIRQPQRWPVEALRVLRPEYDGEPDHAQAERDIRHGRRA